MAKRNIKIKDSVLDENYLGKFKLFIREERYEYSPKSARTSHNWDWERKTILTLRAQFKNELLNNVEDDYEMLYRTNENKDSFKVIPFCDGEISLAKTKLQSLVRGRQIFLSTKEKKAWVYQPNHKHLWGFNKKDITNLVKAHQRAKSPIRQFGYEERLTDANFHSLCTYLSEKDYYGCFKWIEQNYCK